MTLSPADLVQSLAVFAATNIDTLVLFLVFAAGGEYRLREVVVGQFAGLVLLILFSAAASMSTTLLPREYVRYLGLVPLAVGLGKLRQHSGEGSGDGQRGENPSVRGPRMLAVLLATLASGGDNVSAYVPLFAAKAGRGATELAALYLVSAAWWCGMSALLVRSGGALIDPVRRLGRAVLPWALMLIGAAMLLGASRV